MIDVAIFGYKNHIQTSFDDDGDDDYYDYNVDNNDDDVMMPLPLQPVLHWNVVTLLLQMI